MLEKSVPQQQEIGIHNIVKETRSSSCRLNDQNKIIRNRGCLINPLGFPYRSRMQVLAADAPSGSGELLIMNDLPVYKRGRNKIQEAIEEAEQKKRKDEFKNRISAAKSRASSYDFNFHRCNCFPILRLRSCFEGAYKISGRKSGAIEK
ncbi:hypothetical protein ERO13_A03G116238v2 [Gossypium hirsutum]|nr:hypothetical protein ERO13_A03G116238v2 [Gossypium hirsutum]